MAWSWDELRTRFFAAANWDYGRMSAHESGLGNFHLCNLAWPPPVSRLSLRERTSFRGAKGDNDKVLRLALPPGIGDAFWCLLKVPALCRREGACVVDIEVCGGPPYRSREFLEAFDFVRSVSHTDLRIIEADFTTPGGEYNYAPSSRAGITTLTGCSRPTATSSAAGASRTGCRSWQSTGR